jgi:hypothetical protein
MPANNSKHLVESGDRFYRLTVVSFSHHDKRWRRHYLVCCDCGNEKTVQGTLLRSGNTRSCGCLAKEAKATKRKPDNGGELTAVILGYKRHAANRGLSWNLDREYVRSIISKPCYYCGALSSNEKITKNTKTPFKYNGIDRSDNAVGYEESNVLPCCFVCNRAKSDMSAAEFRKWMNGIAAMAEQWGNL